MILPFNWLYVGVYPRWDWVCLLRLLDLVYDWRAFSWFVGGCCGLIMSIFRTGSDQPLVLWAMSVHGFLWSLFLFSGLKVAAWSREVFQSWRYLAVVSWCTFWLVKLTLNRATVSSRSSIGCEIRGGSLSTRQQELCGISGCWTAIFGVIVRLWHRWIFHIPLAFHYWIRIPMIGPPFFDNFLDLTKFRAFSTAHILSASFAPGFFLIHVNLYRLVPTLFHGQIVQVYKSLVWRRLSGRGGYAHITRWSCSWSWWRCAFVFWAFIFATISQYFIPFFDHKTFVFAAITFFFSSHAIQVQLFVYCAPTSSILISRFWGWKAREWLFGRKWFGWTIFDFLKSTCCTIIRSTKNSGLVDW